MPTVSVLLPCFNGAQFLKEAIDSIISQTFLDWELIVIDDGSTDATELMMKEYLDKRVKYLRNDENKGLVYSLNKGIDQAKGRYIARMDADDISLPERLERQVEFLEKHPEISVVDVRQKFIDENGSPTGNYNSDITGCANIKKTLPWYNCMGHPSVMMRAEVINANKYRKVVYEDYDLWLRLISAGFKLERTLDPLLFYRVHNLSIIGQSQKSNQHFKKIADTKFFYLTHLPLSGRLQLFNLKIFIAMNIDYLTWGFKKLKGIFRP